MQKHAKLKWWLQSVEDSVLDISESRLEQEDSSQLVVLRKEFEEVVKMKVVGDDVLDSSGPLDLVALVVPASPARLNGSLASFLGEVVEGRLEIQPINAGGDCSKPISAKLAKAKFQRYAQDVTQASTSASNGCFGCGYGFVGITAAEGDFGKKGSRRGGWKCRHVLLEWSSWPRKC